MTAAEHAPDPVRAFTAALNAATRQHYAAVAYDAMPLVRIACERVTPAELAKIVSIGIGWHTPANADALILFRLRREAGQLHDEEGA